MVGQYALQLSEVTSNHCWWLPYVVNAIGSKLTQTFFAFSRINRNRPRSAHARSPVEVIGSLWHILGPRQFKLHTSYNKMSRTIPSQSYGSASAISELFIFRLKLFPFITSNGLSIEWGKGLCDRELIIKRSDQ